MKLGILAPLLVCLGFACVSAVGCSSEDGSGGGTPSDFSPPGNGVPTSESAACNAIKQAYGGRLECGPKTLPACPGLISAGNPACSQYDQGTVDACVEFIAGQACSELGKRKCIVKALPSTAPNGCPVVDAGPDAEADAGTDAAEDAPADVTPDAPEDSGADTAADATSDVTSDAADAATE